MKMHVAVISDYLEEQWPSMDLVAEMLIANLKSSHNLVIQASRILPKMNHRFTKIPHFGNADVAGHADKLVNRFWDYPRQLKNKSGEFDLFHIVDHSYSQLVHSLPPERTIVTCHDVDTFRSVLEPETVRRSYAFRAMTNRILDGLRKAAMVVCDSVATRDELLKYNVLPLDRLRIVPLGVHPTCSPSPDGVADNEVNRLLGPVSDGVIDLLHVGSTIPRKRIDVLLRILAEVKKEIPQVRLLRVGGDFTEEQHRQFESQGITSSILVLPPLNRSVLSAVYRRAALVLLPSEREGFGLPVVESMACGTPIVTSDLEVLREVGGDAAVYRPVADVRAWSEIVIRLLNERRDKPQSWATRRAEGITQSARFSWAEYARRMVELYREVL